MLCLKLLYPVLGDRLVTGSSAKNGEWRKNTRVTRKTPRSSLRKLWCQKLYSCDYIKNSLSLQLRFPSLEVFIIQLTDFFNANICIDRIYTPDVQWNCLSSKMVSGFVSNKTFHLHTRFIFFHCSYGLLRSSIVRGEILESKISDFGLSGLLRKCWCCSGHYCQCEVVLPWNKRKFFTSPDRTEHLETLETYLEPRWNV